MENLHETFAALEKLIGNTPLIEISFKFKGEPMKIYTKLEYYNYTGSIKDRLALHILKKSYEENKITKAHKILEATSGNTGISFSALGKFLGNPVCIFMPDWMSEERKNLMRSFGAEIELVSKEDGGFLRCIELTKKLAEEDSMIFLPSQFSNEDNIEAHYLSTGPEIWRDLRNLNLIPDAFIAGVGTGGTVMGTGKYLKEMNPNIKVHPLEPSNSPTLSTGYKVCSHRIQGISDEFIPEILKLKELDEIVSVDDGDSIIMAQKLSSKLGLGVGISSGANFLGALKLLQKMGKTSVVVTVFSDDNKKYLSTDLMKYENPKEGFLSTDIELLGIKSI